MVKEPFCPLYVEAIQAAPWKKTETAHAGLLFDKFPDAWRYKHDRNGNRTFPVELEFDKGVGQKKEGANEWLNRFKRPVGDKARLAEACERQQSLIESLGGTVVLVKNVDRFVTGMGREHPLENGFVWHPTLGVPYLPGSSLKGMLRAWQREARDGKEDDDLLRLFGEQASMGTIIVFDMLPLEPPRLDVDVMTPHYGPYYQDQAGQTPPGDWHSPNPISFLVVAREQLWQIGVAPAGRPNPLGETELSEVIIALLDALQIAGAGAKTAVGYGRFERDQAAEEQQRQKSEKRRLEKEAAKQQAAAKAAFEQTLARASEPLQSLMKRQRDEAWKQEPGDQKMIAGLTAVVDQSGELPADCIDWIRSWVESIPGYAGVWDQPDLMTGKRKDKPKYGSKAIREMVKRIKAKQK